MSVYLHTQRLEFLRPTPQDFSLLFSLYSDPVAMKHMGGARTAEVTRAILAATVEQWKFHGFGTGFIRDKATKKIIGFAGIKYFENEANLGWVFYEEFHGKGLGFEISKALIEDVFRNHGIRRITAGTNEENLAAVKLLEKLGFRYVKDVSVTFFGITTACKHFELEKKKS